MRIHRETVYKAGTGLSAIMAWQPLVFLGTISFPFYILHGPLGQLFYKKVIAMKVFGQVRTTTHALPALHPRVHTSHTG
jgi:peptidoglycan/LPS O-acetylase OafA/YrhL